MKSAKLFLSTLFLCTGAACGATFHVTPDGDDSRPAGPFASIERGLQAARQNADPTDTIEVHAGVYRLRNPIVLTPEDSSVVIKAHEKDAVVVSGGSVVTGWREAELNGRKVWTAKLPEGVKSPRQFWVGDDARPGARHPNSGTFSIPQAPEPKAAWTDGSFRFQYAPGDVPPAFTIDDAEVVLFNRWVESRLPVIRNDSSQHELRFSRRTVFKTDAGDMYRIENAPEFLDEPGEWFLRSKTGEFFYLPKPGERIETFQPVVPRLSQLVKIEGSLEKGRFVENVSFKGITFAHAEWSLPAPQLEPDGKPPRGGFSQAANTVPGTVELIGARNCAFEDCRFIHLGSYGIELGRGSQQSRIERCTLDDIGAGGIKIGEFEMRKPEAEHVRANRVVDCTISNYGKLFASGVGILIGQSYDNVISHNEIRDGFYSGLSAGWTWGYEPALTRANVIENNHIHHIGKLSTGEGPLLSDMGGIYMLGPQPKSVIRMNRIHDVDGRVYGGWGIYLDEGSSDVLVEKNLVFNTTHGGFHQHYGKENVVRNNVFAFGRTRQIERSRSEPHRSFTFERNIVTWNQGEGIVGDWSNYNVIMRNNQYWPFEKATANFAYQDFAAWRKKGVDEGSVVADPGFVNPTGGDFQFKPGAGPAKSIGFETWDLRDVGPRLRLARD